MRFCGSTICSPLGRCRQSRQRGFLIYRLLCGRAFSVRKSLRAVRTVERNRYIENTPLGTPSGTAVGGKQLFFWLQKSGVNIKKCRRCHWSGNTTPPARKCCSVGGIKAQVCPFAVNRSRFGLRYSRVRGRRQSKFLASSSTGGARNFYPYTGEPRNALQPRGATLHRGAEICSQLPRRV